MESGQTPSEPVKKPSVVFDAPDLSVDGELERKVSRKRGHPP